MPARGSLRKEHYVAGVTPDVRNLQVKDLGAMEDDVLPPPQVDAELAFDGRPLIEIEGNVRAAGVGVEVDFTVIITADEKHASHGKQSDLELSRTERLFLSGSRARTGQQPEARRQQHRSQHRHV